jgi:ABC-type nitrate/sulfonate/bicarbonate transport system permease component
MKKLISPIVALLLWELIARFELVNPLFLPPPSKIFLYLGEMIRSFEIFKHTGSSLGRVAAGFGLAVVTAIPLGIAMGWFKTIDTIVDPIVELIRPVSPIAILPLAILWFGIGDASKIFIIWLSCTFPILIATYSAVKGLDRSFIYAATSLGANQWEVLRTVAVPAAMPQIYAGVRISVGVGLIVIISSEMVAARHGLGLVMAWDT